MATIKNNSELENYIRSVDWSQYNTAYGNANVDRYNIPKLETLLLRLFSDERKVAITSSALIGSCVCHQNVYLSTAALPACDVILYGLKILDDVIKEELTLTVWGLVFLFLKINRKIPGNGRFERK